MDVRIEAGVLREEGEVLAIWFDRYDLCIRISLSEVDCRAADMSAAIDDGFRCGSIQRVLSKQEDLAEDAHVLRLCPQDEGTGLSGNGKLVPGAKRWPRRSAAIIWGPRIGPKRVMYCEIRRSTTQTLPQPDLLSNVKAAHH